MFNRLKNCHCTKCKGVNCNWVFFLRNSFKVSILSGLERPLAWAYKMHCVFVWSVSGAGSVFCGRVRGEA